MTDNPVKLPAVVGMNQMAGLLNLSRSRLYQLVYEGVLLPPIYSLKNKRPFYPEEMARRNMEVKRNNVGINGQILVFYASKDKKVVQTLYKKTASKKQTQKTPYDDLIEGLEALGIIDVEPSQIEAAVAYCFPEGTENQDSDEVLRTVFRHLKCRNTEHKQRT